MIDPAKPESTDCRIIPSVWSHTQDTGDSQPHDRIESTLLDAKLSTMAMFPRIQAALGGTRLEEITEDTLQLLIDGQVREDTEIEFKSETYGRSDSEHRDLAGDVAALANSIGGVIFLGLREEAGVAIERTPVELTDGEEIRMRQIVAELVAPSPKIDFIWVDSAEADRGYYLLVVPPSPWRPHAVRINQGLRYPRRDGPRIRYLSETEVADMYRSRFVSESAQRTRLDQVHSEGMGNVSAAERLWLTLSLVPDVPGEIRLDRTTVQRLRQFAERYSGGFGSMVFGGFDVATGLRRVVVRTGPPIGLSTVAHVELHTDGSAFAGTAVWERREQPPPGRLPGDDIQGRPWLEDEYLVTQLIALMRLAVEYAVAHCGVAGNAAVRVGLDGFQREDGLYLTPPRLMHRRRHGLAEPRSRVELLRPPVSLHTVDLISCFGSARELLVASRLVLADIFQSFGVPEVEQIHENGAIRRLYFSRQMHDHLQVWSERQRVDVLDSTLDEEREAGHG